MAALPAGCPEQETPDDQGAFPRLSDGQLALLAEHGERRALAPGEVLFAEGEPCRDCYVILRGRIGVVEDTGGRPEVVRVHGPGRFLGELGLLAGQPAFQSTVACVPAEVLVVPVARLRRIVASNPVLGDLILRACLVRRSLLIHEGAGFRIIGSCYSPDARRLREFAARNRLPHRWIDVEQDPGAEATLRRFGLSTGDTPVVVLGGRLLRNPGDDELARLLGLRRLPREPGLIDLLVVGAGPGGLAAAVYGASDGLRTVIADAVAAGGQAGTSSRIENYLGFPSGISGAELAERAVLQAGKFGAQLTVPAGATGIERCDGHYAVGFDDGVSVNARAVVVATGARYRKLDVPGIERFEGAGVYYAATELEALACGGRPVAIAGGGNSAGQAAVFLAGRVPRVYLIVRGEALGQSMSRYLVDRIEQHPRIEPLLRTEVCAVHGGPVLDEITVREKETGRTRRLATPNLFVFIGALPGTAWLHGALAVDERGYLLTGSEALGGGTHLGRAPFALETTWPGVFAVGDVRSGSTKRVASAVGEGAMAVHLLHRYLEQFTRAR
ncbi:FAD-dependent oxidoreductase [Amycolatopsis acidiphila]|uniref:Cyclic nucleotide-binding domain-containing protein n=1 Tax=Amycolatopsis acidiphila TaxID=715473 RepID=A0A558AL65_9PSEU|nr:FAD-dependent oxidoreductase [Amycolatopsis acidiphila]TVT24951.1 cyclic nucleotide-binding domain-containing protein [Amycolatopsis acidiphila]UIJ57550.1 FAD-dependent oxidoreductase [Amycolatopsis acidiphila]GHG89434.1 thioredoxin reductase [Amycolatopsis acidiphila]